MITVDLITGMVIVVGTIVAFLMALLVVQIYRGNKDNSHHNGSH
ncbi:MAG: hypothetical protein FD165_247 [Gammaproteobacteria bacterium]|nr:MAG: hypothetical protein FD165_247 [Gammaproteobacteria bacterium]TND06825.1 MAG: hypothetical protein FD120_557 [Gammaproteobacteria bacterium]